MFLFILFNSEKTYHNWIHCTSKGENILRYITIGIDDFHFKTGDFDKYNQNIKKWCH